MQRLCSLVDIQITVSSVDVWLTKQVQHDDGVKYMRGETATQKHSVHNILTEIGVTCTANGDGRRGEGNCKKYQILILIDSDQSIYQTVKLFYG